MLKITPLMAEHIAPIVKAFRNYGGDKSGDKFLHLLEAQKIGMQSAWIATIDNDMAGYVTIVWESCLPEFAGHKIPEISDLNVLPKYRKQGIGNRILDEIEKIAQSRSQVIGIGVGLTDDYGNAQRLYVKRGYVPLGTGLTFKYKKVAHGDQVKVDDDLVFWFTKKFDKERSCK